MARRVQRSVEKGGEGDPLAARLDSIVEFATLADVSVEWVRLRIAEGFIPKAARGRVDLIEATRGTAWYFETVKRRAEERAEDDTANRYRNARAQEIETRMERTRAGLIERAEVEEALEKVAEIALAELRRVVETMPVKVRAQAAKVEARITDDMIGKRVAYLRRALITGDFDNFDKVV